MKNDLAEILQKAKRLEWRLEESDSDTIVFYQLNPGAESVAKLKNRLNISTLPMKLMLNREPGVDLGVSTYVVGEEEWLKAINLACDHFFPMPSHLKLIAVTGTNGKSTTVDLAIQLAAQAGVPGFSVGTLGVRAEGKTHEEFGLTTPGPIQLRKILFEYGSSRKFCAMEASSHAIVQGRIAGLKFVAAAWTSFSQDHLDYHQTMENYFLAKQQLTNYLIPGACFFVPHTQSELLTKLKNIKQIKATNPLPVKASDLPSFFGALFNLENLECARELAIAAGSDELLFKWNKLVPPPGRFHVTEWSQRMAVVDFAHTPDALDNICQAIKQSYPGKKLVVIFGCGGDRDRTKRPLMGQVVARYADQIILTSDNPRSENPDRIIQDIEDGIKTFKNLSKDAERPRALQTALSALKENEILLVAGKGHEDYIQIGQTKIPYSDQGEIEKFLQRNGHG